MVPVLPTSRESERFALVAESDVYKRVNQCGVGGKYRVQRTLFSCRKVNAEGTERTFEREKGGVQCEGPGAESQKGDTRLCQRFEAGG
jgi:hypothetical protein